MPSFEKRNFFLQLRGTSLTNQTDAVSQTPARRREQSKKVLSPDFRPDEFGKSESSGADMDEWHACLRRSRCVGKKVVSQKDELLRQQSKAFLRPQQQLRTGLADHHAFGRIVELHAQRLPERSGFRMHRPRPGRMRHVKIAHHGTGATTDGIGRRLYLFKRDRPVAADEHPFRLAGRLHRIFTDEQTPVCKSGNIIACEHKHRRTRMVVVEILHRRFTGEKKLLRPAGKTYSIEKRKGLRPCAWNYSRRIRTDGA